MSCKQMMDIERVVKDIQKQYGIQLDYNYIDLLKRPLCSEVCHGRCRKEYMCYKNSPK